MNSRLFGNSYKKPLSSSSFVSPIHSNLPSRPSKIPKMYSHLGKILKTKQI